MLFLHSALAVHHLAAARRRRAPAAAWRQASRTRRRRHRPAWPGPVNTLLGWWKWGALVAGVFGLIGCGAMMAIGRRNRSSLAADGATGIPWVLAGLTLIALSSGIVGVFM